MSKIVDNIMVFWASFLKNHSSFMVGGKENLPETIKKYDDLIIIFGHPKCKPCQQIMMKLPIYIFKIWKKKSHLKFCNVKQNCETCKIHGIKVAPTLVLYKAWKEILKLEDEKEIFKFLKEI